MSKVVVISQVPPPIHGSTIMTQVLLRALAALGHDSILVDRRFSASVDQIGKFTLGKLLSAAYIPLRLLLVLLRNRPDVVVFFATNRTFSFVVDWVLSEVLRWSRVRRINYLHAIGFEAIARRNRVFAWMVSRLLRSAHTTVCLGPPLATDVTRWVDPARIVFIPNAVTGRPSDLAQRDPKASPLVLFLSNLIPEKGAGTFVDLAIELAPEMTDARFVVAGATADEEFTASLVTKVTEAGLSDRVSFPGAIVDQREKWQLIRDACVLVFPAMSEAFGLVLAEALGCGTPVVTYRVGALAPAIEEAGAGIVVDERDAVALAQGVRQVLARNDLAQSLSLAARRHFEREYTEAIFQSRWGELLNGGSDVR